MATYLLELGVEEFPSRYIRSTKEQLEENVAAGMRDAGLSCASIRVEATPRRFTLWLNDLQAEQAEDEIVRGPSKKAAYDEAGEPTKALLGFLRSKGASVAETYIENNGKDDYVFLRVHQDEVSVEASLKQLIPAAIRKISNPRAMRWGGKNIRFLRPIRWIVSMLDDQVLSFDLEGIPVGNRTNGHRFLGAKNLEIPSVDQYEALMEKNFVIVDAKKRRDIILRGLNRLARENGGVPYHNEELLEEVVYIVEYPTVFIGDVPTSYLSLPPEVIITPMMDHQRYFPVVDDHGTLLPYFLSVRNGDTHGLQNVIDGNRKVLIPRLEDARFFYDQDCAKPLEEYVSHLDELVFHEELGTMQEKTQRLESLGVKLAYQLDCGEATAQVVERAAHLSKADLVTRMVVEFTELQGTMGRIYAHASGESDRVAAAIEEHYMPRQSGGALPESTAGMVLSIADKIDSLAGLFAIGVNVTGSQDPFGLRRAAIGILEMIRKDSLHFNLKQIVREALLLYVEQKGLVFDYDEVVQRISEFFRGRLRTKLQEQGIRYDAIEAVLGTEDEDLLRLMRKAEVVDALLQKEDQWVTGFVRIDSMAKHAETSVWDPGSLQDEDQAMAASMERADAVSAAIDKDHYEEAIQLLVDWLPIINQYLDETMILVDDPVLRASRLGMLAQVDRLIRRILVPATIVRE